jgi:flagellar biosynthesis GTPase FlhF
MKGKFFGGRQMLIKRTKMAYVSVLLVGIFLSMGCSSNQIRDAGIAAKETYQNELAFEEFWEDYLLKQKRGQFQVMQIRKARAEAEAQARAQEIARQEAEAQARAQEIARQEAEAQARAQEIARQEAEAQARAQEVARQEAEAQARAQEVARQEAEAQARAQEIARQEAELQAPPPTTTAETQVPQPSEQPAPSTSTSTTTTDQPEHAAQTPVPPLPSDDTPVVPSFPGSPTPKSTMDGTGVDLNGNGWNDDFERMVESAKKVDERGGGDGYWN